MKTELVCEGKYVEYGAPRAVKLPALPLRQIETIDEPQVQVFEAGILEAKPKKAKSNIAWEHTTTVVEVKG